MRTGLTIFPGVIDAHVHFNEPGRTDWEGSHRLARGGGGRNDDRFRNAAQRTSANDRRSGVSILKRAAAEAQSLVDFGLWGGLVPGNVEQLETLRDRGVVGFKAFMSRQRDRRFPRG